MENEAVALVEMQMGQLRGPSRERRRDPFSRAPVLLVRSRCRIWSFLHRSQTG